MNIVDLRNQKNSVTSGEKNIEKRNTKEEENYLTEKDVREHIDNSQGINPQRRQLLKFLLVGGGAFVLGWLTKSLGLSGLFSKSPAEKPKPETQKEIEFGDWRIEKKDKEIIFYDKKTNDEVLILD